MKKKHLIVSSIVIVVIIGAVLLVLGLCGVFNNDAKEVCITNIEGCESLEIPASSIAVEFNDVYVGKFTITDVELINEIHNLVLDGVYYKEKKNYIQPPGNNRYICFVYEDGTEINMSTAVVRSKSGDIYSYDGGNELSTLLEEIGLSLGSIVSR